MSFVVSNIDRAIVMTQYDLRGFSHPMYGRMEPRSSPKSLQATTANLASFAAGLCKGDSTDPSYVDYFSCTFEEYLNMCQKLAADCDLSQKEAIGLIVQEIVKQMEEMKAEVAKGTMDRSPYLQALDKSNRWGRAVLALAEAFDVKLREAA